jgi:hypothetical protein
MALVAVMRSGSGRETGGGWCFDVASARGKLVLVKGETKGSVTSRV